MAFPQSSWLASGQDRPLGGRIPALLRSLLDTEGNFQEVFMGCTIYAASPKALPADEAPGQERYYQVPHYRFSHGNCSQRIAANRARSVNTSTPWVHWRHWIFKVVVMSYTYEVNSGVREGRLNWANWDVDSASGEYLSQSPIFWHSLYICVEKFYLKQ